VHSGSPALEVAFGKAVSITVAASCTMAFPVQAGWPATKQCGFLVDADRRQGPSFLADRNARSTSEMIRAARSRFV
jgi:hypothetical protein